MGVKIAHASLSENGTINGKPGDQNTREVCIRDWYNKPWNVVIRFKDPNAAERFAQDMEAAALNEHVGYGQKDRNEVYIEGKKVGFDLSKITVNVNCDCSSLVSVACIYAGIFENTMYSYGNCCTTSNLKKALQKTGMVDVFESSDYTQSPDKLKRGDILLSEGHHVAGVVSGNVLGEKPADPEIVKLVLSGKMGNGIDRIQRVLSYGYNYESVRRKVNEIITQSEVLFHIKKGLGEYWDIALEQVK